MLYRQPKRPSGRMTGDGLPALTRQANNTTHKEATP